MNLYIISLFIIIIIIIIIIIFIVLISVMMRKIKMMMIKWHTVKAAEKKEVLLQWKKKKGILYSKMIVAANGILHFSCYLLFALTTANPPNTPAVALNWPPAAPRRRPPPPAGPRPRPG